MSGSTVSDRREEDDWNRIINGDSTTGLQSLIPTNIGGSDAIKHADDAIDFEGEDELADDEDEIAASGNNDIHSFGNEEDELERLAREGQAGGAGDNLDDPDSNDWLKELQAEADPLNAVSGVSHDQSQDLGGIIGGENMADLAGLGLNDNEDIKNNNNSEFPQDQDMMYEDNPVDMFTTEELLHLYFPDFKPGAILKLNSLFGPKPTKLIMQKPKNVRHCIPTRLALDVEQDQKNLFVMNTEKSSRNLSNIIYVDTGRRDMKKTSFKTHQLEIQADEKEKDLLLATAEWDISELSDLAEEFANNDNNEIQKSKTQASNAVVTIRDHLKKRPIDEDDVYDDFTEEAILEGNLALVPKKAHLDLNDPNLLFVNDMNVRKSKSNNNSAKLIPTNERALELRYNISNDRAYDTLKDNYRSKVRATIGNLDIDHSLVALRLQSPHYKVKLSKSQLRSFHRPTFSVKANTTIQFTKIKHRKKKKDKGKPISQLLAKTTDLTLGDSAPFVMLEYSEEFPLVLSNYGMGSKLINYYRKKSEEDTSRPKLPVGETHVLGVQDRSAFWNFGFVEAGNIVPTLYNRMIRAPIFQHKANSTDFLLIRSTGGGAGTRYHLRSIPQIFVVGQTYPVTQIPGPHSRKVTSASKNRLKMIVYRVLNKNEYHRLQVKDISGHFPDQNDMQNRQRLKEFMEYQRNGDDQGYWKIKSNAVLPTEDEIRAMIQPEDIALLEAMQVGQQHLLDSGYGKTVDDDADDNDGMSIEEQLAPWNISRNFINATQGKAMLQLHGEGDPTGRGLAFSFLRTSMKGGFKAQGESVNEKLDKSKFGGHSYNVALQQKTYDDEIARIWYAQAKNLSSSVVPDHSWDEAETMREEAAAAAQQNSTPGPDARDDDDASLFSHTSGKNTQNKVLRITRFFRDENGIKQRNVELIRDPNVIRAYVNRRHEIEDAQMAIDEIAPTNDEERNKRLRRILEENLARKQRNQDRRIARRGKSTGNAKHTTRRCATCGAIGHIRTNKSCPLYNEAFLGAIPATNANTGNSLMPNP